MRVAALGLLFLATFACAASAAKPLRVSVAGKPPGAVAGRTWTLRLAVRPASYAGTIRVIASGPIRISARASGRRGSFRARLVLPSAGRWALSARAGSATFRLGTVRVRPTPPQPLTFSEPTSIDLQPDGSLLLVENNPGRLLRVDAATGSVTALASLERPFAVVRAPSGSVFVTSENSLRRLDPGGAPAAVAEAESDIGPLAVAPNGDVYFTTATWVFRLAGGSGSPVPIAGTGILGGGGDGGPAVDAQVSAPHGIAVAADGAVLISDTGNDRIRRIDPASAVISAFAQVGIPGGIDVAGDGTVYVVDGRERRVVHLSTAGERMGFVGPAFGLPYDVEVAPDGVLYLLEGGPSGRLRRMAPDGTVTTVSR
jgi:sugar lactone lactonase YvrE